MHTVSPGESVAVLPKDEVFDYGDNVTLNCTARGGPNNAFLWLFNDSVAIAGNYLTLTTVDAPQGGEYTCVASNGAGNGNESTTVFVSPRITRSPFSMNTTNGSMVMLMCEAEALPEPQYEWFFSGGTIGDNVLPTMGGNYLTFNPVLFGDEGDYYCRATSNNFTVHSENATITGTLEP